MLKIIPRFIKILPLFFLVLFAACQKNVLLQELSQRDANEAQVLLAKNGIQTHKEAATVQQKTTWTIYVDSGDEEAARELLAAHHLPREKELGLEGMCKDSILIPSPKAEKCRELLGLKGEIINSLESLPGVVDAEMVINIPDKEDFPDENIPQLRPTASIIVQFEVSEGQPVLTEERVQRFVANAIVGMDMRDVTVILSHNAPSPTADVITATDPVVEDKAPDPQEVTNDSVVADNTNLTSIGGLQMDDSSAQRFKVMAVLFLAFFVILSVALILVLLKIARMRQKAPVGPAAANQGALPERAQMDQLIEETKE